MADGSITIDTRVNPRGFNQGVNGLISALKPLAIALASVFAIRGIVNFGRSAVDEAAKMSSALIGLQSIVEGTGNSFPRAQEFINSFVADGLLPAQNAITAYKNLLLRGYDVSQIETTLEVLKNSAAFGRQGSLTLGQAVESATEGLKNENSILVDNAGITKNVSLIWRDYAVSIGTTVGALTKQQKITAEVLGLQEEARFQMGDAAKLAGTYSGEISALGVSFLNLKIAIGNAIIPIIQAVLPWIRAAIDALTIFFNRVATIIGILFGVDIGAARQSMEQSAAVTEAVASGANQAAAAQEGLAKSTKKAAKEAKGALAPFDELNVLQMETADVGEVGGAGGAPSAPAAGGIGGLELPAPDTAAFDEGLEKLRATVEEWKNKILEFFRPAAEALGRLWQDAQPLITTLGNIFLWLWNEVLIPYVTWLVQEFYPALLDIIGPILLIINNILVALGPAWLWLWKNILQPIFAWIGDVLIGALGEVSDALIKVGDFIKDNPKLGAILGVIAIGFFLIASGALAAAAGLIATLAPILLIIGAIVLIAVLINHWGEIMKWFGDLWNTIITNIKLSFGIFLNNIKLGWELAWNFIKSIWDRFWTGINIGIVAAKTLFANFWNGLKTGWDKLTGGLETAWENTWNGIKTFVKNTINGIIDFINGMIRAVVKGINGVIGAINGIGFDLPELLGGGHVGFNIGTVSAPQIPRLATGAVIPPNAEFAAILGDQRAGKNIETPEALMRQIVREELGALAGGDMTITMPVYLDSEKIYEGQKKVQRRRGTSLVMGGA